LGLIRVGAGGGVFTGDMGVGLIVCGGVFTGLTDTGFTGIGLTNCGMGFGGFVACMGTSIGLGGLGFTGGGGGVCAIRTFNGRVADTVFTANEM
jgi:hypothetical protein